MKLGIRMVVIAGAALAAPLAYAAGADVFAPYDEDYTRGEPISPEMLKKIEHARALLFPEQSPPRTADAEPRRPPRNPREGVAMPGARAVPSVRAVDNALPGM
jgi:hypothetical protein